MKINFAKVPIPLSKVFIMNIKKLFIYLFCALSFAFTYETALSQNIKIEIENDKEISVIEAFDLVKKSTDYSFIYKTGDFQNAPKIKLNKGVITANELLTECLAFSNYYYEIIDKKIIIKQKDSPLKKSEVKASQSKPIKITGVVTDENNLPLPSTTVFIEGTKTGTMTDADGKYEISAEVGSTISFSFIGFVTKKIKVAEQTEINVSLKEVASELDEFVITGFVNKPKESFTGAAISVEGSDLLSVGNSNLLESLQAFVPGLLRVENIDMGADPNALPEIIIRGRSSFSGDTNIPTFIMDGAEVSLESVFDLDLSYIEQVTVLKDAAAAALYGSKAANGVIVITTKKVEAGKIRVAYNGSVRMNFADLSDYNLLNARDKLEYERLAGLYTSQYGNGPQQYALDELYNVKLQTVNEGVNTDWMAKPLRLGITHSNSLRLYGGSDNTRYSLNVRIGNDEGVMKTSFRKRQSIDFVLSHNIEQKIFFQNTVSMDFVDNQNSKYGSFSDYVRLNPYDRPTIKDGDVLNKVLSYNQRNPLREAELGSYSKGERSSFRNTFDIRWNVFKDLQLQGNMSITKGSAENSNFRSPESYAFEGRALEEKGSISISNSNDFSLQGNIIGSYNKTFKEGTLLIASLGTNFHHSKGSSNGYRAVGFLSDKLKTPQWAIRYPENERPSGYDDISRLLGYFVNLNYIYDNRYYADFSFRTEGSSKFGSENRFAPFWSAGVGWNIHREKFLENSSVFNILRLRSSYGLLGNASFSPYQSMTTYEYSVDNYYKYGIGANPITIGNKNLSWERTLNYNVGLEVGLFNGKVKLDVDWYKKITNDLLLDVTKAPSVGVETAKENLGKINNTGLELNARVIVLRKNDWEWSVNLTASHNRNKIVEIGEALKAQNERVNANLEGDDLRRITPFYEEGESLTAVKLVKSGGIDPATGKEVYIDRFGNPTFIYDFKDKIHFGDSDADLYGVIGTYLSYKGLSLDVKFDYSLGATVYNSTLVTRIEGSNPRFNADQRVFDSRWKKPGDVTIYRDIADTSTPYQSSRFVDDEYRLRLFSLNVAYDVSRDMCRKIGLSSLRFELLTNNLFTASTIKQERGLTNPFQRSFQFSVRTNF